MSKPFHWQLFGTVGVLAVLGLHQCGVALEPRFRVHSINPQSEFCACAVFDVDKDGRLDIVCGGWWYRAPDWQRFFVREVEVIRGRFDDYSNLPFDVNGDGWLDLVSANYRSSKLAWVEHPGARLGKWTEHVVDVPGPMETARLFDVDGDGRIDLLPNGVSFAAWWQIGRPRDGANPRWIRHDLPNDVAGHGVGFGDINGDGRGDVVGPRGWAEAPPDPRTGRWIFHREFQLHRDCSIPILVLDVDGDGDSDLVWGRGHNIGVYWLEQRSRPNPAAREWRLHAIDTSISQCHSLIAVDLDNDNSPEVVAGKRFLGHEGRDAGEYDPLAVHFYRFDRHTRSWNRGEVSRGGRAAFGLDPKAADLDRDGDVDFVGADRSGLFWFENLGNQSPPQETAQPLAAPHYPDHAQLMIVTDSDGIHRPVKTPFDWCQRRAHVLQNMQVVMGEFPEPSRRAPLEAQVLEEVRLAKYTRRKLTYCAEPGDRVPAYLLIPHERAGKLPAMLCLHQTVSIGKAEPAGLGKRETLDYAHELAERGYVCLAPDYPSFGDYAFDFAKARDRYASGSMKAIWNNVRALDFLESMAEVNPDRIGCIGHSLGGHNTLFTAAFDQRIRVMVTSCGFTAFHHYYAGKLAGWTSDRYMPRIRDTFGNDPSKVPFDFYEVTAALAPRPLFINAPLHDSNFDVVGVRKVVAETSKVYALFDAGDRLSVVYPDSAHDFPDPVREQAYQWLDRWLKN